MSTQQPDNPSWAKLVRDIGADAALLNYLPYRRAKFKRQSEILEPAPERILYSDMMEAKGQLWIYFTLNYNVPRSNPDYRMITFNTIERARNSDDGVRPTDVKDIALAAWPFKHAKDPHAIIAIARYFFIRTSIDKQLQQPLSCEPFKEDLLRVCSGYEALYDKTQAKRPIVAAEGCLDAAPLQPRGLRQPSYAGSMARSSRESSAAPSPIAGRVSIRKRPHSPGPDSNDSLKHRLQPGAQDVSQYEAGRNPHTLIRRLRCRLRKSTRSIATTEFRARQQATMSACLT